MNIFWLYLLLMKIVEIQNPNCPLSWEKSIKRGYYESWTAGLFLGTLSQTKWIGMINFPSIAHWMSGFCEHQADPLGKIVQLQWAHLCIFKGRVSKLWTSPRENDGKWWLQAWHWFGGFHVFRQPLRYIAFSSHSIRHGHVIFRSGAYLPKNIYQAGWPKGRHCRLHPPRHSKTFRCSKVDPIMKKSIWKS